MQMHHYRAITDDHCHTLGLHNTACHQYLLAEGCNINIYKAHNTPAKPLMHVIASTEPYAENSSLYIQLLQPRQIRQLSSPVFQNCLVNRKLISCQFNCFYNIPHKTNGVCCPDLWKSSNKCQLQEQLGDQIWHHRFLYKI